MHSQFPLFLTHRTSTVFCSVGCKASKPIGRDASDLLDPFGWLCTWYIKNFSSNLEKSPNMFKKNRSQTFRSKKSLSSYTFQRLWFYEGTIPNNNHPLMSDIFHKPFHVAFKHLDSLRAWNSKKNGWRVTLQLSQVVLPAVCQNGNAFGYAARLLRNDPNIAFQVFRGFKKLIGTGGLCL